MLQIRIFGNHIGEVSEKTLERFIKIVSISLLKHSRKTSFNLILRKNSESKHFYNLHASTRIFHHNLLLSIAISCKNAKK